MQYKNPSIQSIQISFDKQTIYEREYPTLLKTTKLEQIFLKIAGVNILIFAHEGVIPRQDIKERFNPFKSVFENPDIIVAPTRKPELFVDYPSDLPSAQGFKEDNNYIFKTAVGNMQFNVERYPMYVTTTYKSTLEDLLGLLRIPLSYFMIHNELGALFHASSVYSPSKNESAIFLGLSGAGKSTAAMHSPGVILSDEVAAIIQSSTEFLLQGTLFGTKLKPDISIAAGVKGYFINKSDKNYLVELKPTQAWKKLFAHLILMPIDKEITNKAMILLEKIIRKVSFYDLYATKDGAFWSDVLKWS